MNGYYYLNDGASVYGVYGVYGVRQKNIERYTKKNLNQCHALFECTFFLYYKLLLDNT